MSPDHSMWGTRDMVTSQKAGRSSCPRDVKKSVETFRLGQDPGIQNHGQHCDGSSVCLKGS